VIGGDLTEALTALKNEDGDADILLACGPTTLGPLASAPGLVDDYVIAVHPAVLPGRPAALRPSHRQPGPSNSSRPSRLRPVSSSSATKRAAVKLSLTSAGLLVERDGAAVEGRR
jgi:hypothetical protein